MRLAPVSVLFVALVAGCGWDEPNAGVFVVSEADVDPAAPQADSGDGAPRSPQSVGDDTLLSAAPASPAETSVPPGERPPLPGSVAVIGDSIALSAQEAVTASLGLHGLDLLAYDARESRRMAEWGGSDLPSGVAAATDVVDAGLEPELWIVALGTNDVGAGTDEATVQDDIDELLAAIPDDAAVIWVDTWVRDMDDRAEVFNQLVRSTLADRPGSWVLDWHGRAAEDGLIVGDGVHLTERGRLEYARLIDGALRDQFDRSG